MPAEHDATHPLTLRERLAWGQQAFVALVLVWLALNGLAAWRSGLVVAGAGAVLAAAVAVGEPYRWRPHRLAAFAAFFVVASFRGGIDVAWRALHPGMPIDPRFVRFPLDLPPGQPRTLMVSTLSLMPGTLSADLEDDGRTLVVHVLTAEAEASVAWLQARVARLFALPAPS